MNDYPALENFFAAYFHQDWTQEHERAEAVVDHYRDSERAELVAQAREELGRLLAQEPDEPALAARVRALGGEYDPTRDGVAWRDWLLAVRRRLSGVA